MTYRPEDLEIRLAAPSGAGPRRGALLLHGLTGAPGEMRYLARKLNRDGFEVRCPLLAGHGRGARAVAMSTWRDWLAGVVDAYDRFAAEVDEVHVGGICAGGALGIALAHARPAVASAAVYSITLLHDGWAFPSWYRAAPFMRPFALLPGIRHIGMPESEPYGIKDQRLRERVAKSPDMGVQGALDVFPVGALAQQYDLIGHVMRVARKVKTPTLILHAREDDQATPANAERLRDAMGGPVELRWLHDSYHMIHVDRERAEVANLTSRFFRRADATAVEAAEPPVTAYA